MAFGLSCHHSAHKSDARCVTGCNGLVASGGRDSLLKLWLPSGDACTVQETKWVNAVTSIVPGRLKSCVHGGIATGSQDGLIRIYSIEGHDLHLQHTLEAHSAPVCSLSWLDRHGHLLLLSGGWDSVAKVWELISAEGSECQATTLSGHENNVCVLGLANGDIITGSSGVRDQVADCVIGFQLRVWQDSLLVQAIAQADGGHTGAIRDLAAIPLIGMLSSFASASNDGTVCVWSLAVASEKYGLALRLAVPSQSFVFGVCFAALPGTERMEPIAGTIFTSDDSGDLCVFDLPASIDKTKCLEILPAQRIRHPKTLWSVAVIEAGHAGRACSLATACADGAVRIFSADSSLHLQAAEQQKSFEPMSEPSPAATQDYTMSTTLPRASERGQFSGSLGAISLFLDDEETRVSGTVGTPAVVAFQWLHNSADDGTSWVKLGQVLDPVPKKPRMEQKSQQEKQELDGELFDYIIPVEVSSESQGELNLLLGVNVGDDPQLVATKFCQRHSLGDEYIPQITMFVEANL